MIRDMADAEIAEALEIKVETVRKRRTAAKRNAGVSTTAGLINHAKNSGWV